MGPKLRRNKQDLDEELEYHIATDWAAFRRFAPKKPIMLPQPVMKFSEGTFCGKPVAEAPGWYLHWLTSGGESFLLWKDKALDAHLNRMGYYKTTHPPLAEPPVPPIAARLWPEQMPKRGPQPDYFPRPLPMIKDPVDRFHLLTQEDVIRATALGPGLRLQNDDDRSKSHDADMKRKLDGLKSDDADKKRKLCGFKSTGTGCNNINDAVNDAVNPPP